MNRFFVRAATTAALLATSPAFSQIAPDFFTDPFEASSGSFVWDQFDSALFPTTSTFTPDAGASGVGAAGMTLSAVAQPLDGPPFPLVTSTDNIYTGGTLADFVVGLSGLADAQPYTTVVLQVAAITGFSGFELGGGLVPTEFVDRGVVDDVLHGDFESPFDTTYYWAEWQLDGADVSDTLDLLFSNTLTHQSLAAIKVDYINSSQQVDALTPSTVPEPASLALLGVGGAVRVMRRRGV